MTTHFAKLMGNIKEIEIDFNKISENLYKNLDIYKDTIKIIDEGLTNIFTLIDKDTINHHNIINIKENYKKFLQISKKEIELPLTNNKKNYERLENGLNKIIAKINLYKETTTKDSKESKPKINHEENDTLQNNITELFAGIQKQKLELEHLFELLLPIKEKLNNIKKHIEQYDYLKKEAKIIIQLTALVTKIQPENHAIANNDLLKQLEILKGRYNSEDSNIASLKLEASNLTNNVSTIDLNDIAANSSSAGPTTLLTQFDLKSANQSLNDELDVDNHEIEDEELEDLTKPENTENLNINNNTKLNNLTI